MSFSKVSRVKWTRDGRSCGAGSCSEKCSHSTAHKLRNLTFLPFGFFMQSACLRRCVLFACALPLLLLLLLSVPVPETKDKRKRERQSKEKELSSQARSSGPFLSLPPSVGSLNPHAELVSLSAWLACLACTLAPLSSTLPCPRRYPTLPHLSICSATPSIPPRSLHSLISSSSRHIRLPSPSPPSASPSFRQIQADSSRSSWFRCHQK